VLFFITLVVVLCQRASEMWLTAKHTRWMQQQGGREYGREHYPWMVLLHAGFLFSLVLEHQLRAPRFFAICLLPLLLAQVMRYSAMWTLGEFWNTRVWVLPGVLPIRRRIFRLMPHPNYVGVTLEILFLPAMFGLWVTAIVFGLLNAWMLWVRIRVENRALRECGISNADAD
jgi:methyltransferase